MRGLMAQSERVEIFERTDQVQTHGRACRWLEYFISTHGWPGRGTGPDTALRTATSGYRIRAPVDVAQERDHFRDVRLRHQESFRGWCCQARGGVNGDLTA